MKHSAKTGIGFGLTSAVITTLGLMVGVNAGTHSRVAVIGSILTVTVADSFSDALGVHILEESQGRYSHSTVWSSTIYTFISKILIGCTFVLPLLILNLPTAIIISMVWGFMLLGVFSYYIGISEEKKTWKVIMEHEIIAIIVVFISHYVGVIISLLIA